METRLHRTCWINGPGAGGGGGVITNSSARRVIGVTVLAGAPRQLIQLVLIGVNISVCVVVPHAEEVCQPVFSSPLRWPPSSRFYRYYCHPAHSSRSSSIPVSTPDQFSLRGTTATKGINSAEEHLSTHNH